MKMYFSDAELEIQSATRSPEPLSQVAENMTVVTAADIERMNAHTLADVLNTVMGVEVQFTAGPGSPSNAGILGSTQAHATVVLDGVVFNDPWNGMAELGLIPVQNIEKIEIVKGPASSAWGSALGGVVNVITKTGRSVDRGGVLSGAYGNSRFGDFRAEARGKQDRFGYYLGAGRLQSRDMTPNVEVLKTSNAYAKLSYDLTDKTDITCSIDYIKRDAEVPYPDEIDKNPEQRLHANIAVNTSLANNLNLNVAAWAINNYANSRWITISTGAFSDHNMAFTGHGESARLIYKAGWQTLVIGGEAEEKTTSVPPLLMDGVIRKEAVYANDTIVFDRLTVIPGVRYEDTSTNKGFAAPSLGVTYALGKDTIIRTFVARGYNIPGAGASLASATWIDSAGTNTWLPNNNLKMETVTSYQAGIESAAMKSLWLKLSLFKNDVRNLAVMQAVATNTVQFVNFGRNRLQGAMLETKTMPIYDISLLAAAEFITAKDLETNETIAGQPVQVYDLGLKYDDKETLNVWLQGRHINWNLKDPTIQTCKTMIVDLTVNKRIHQVKDTSLEVFASGHNLLNTKQIWSAAWPNPERWYEAGVRYTF
jgi:vitamin B12 transporter